MNQMSAEKKSVLVEFSEHSRVVSFHESENEAETIISAVTEAFSDVFQANPPPPFFLQIFDKDWSRYVDVQSGAIPNKSVLRVVLRDATLSKLSTVASVVSDVVILTSSTATSGRPISSPSSFNLKEKLDSTSLHQLKFVDEGGLARLRKASEPSSEESDLEMDTEEIRQQAIIFKKEPLSTYRIKVNEAAQEICMKKPSLLTRRGELLVLAKERVHKSGYAYQKGKSRSKSYGCNAEESSKPKRVKTSQDERNSRMKAIKEELQDLKTRCSFKQKRLEGAEVAKKYKLCDELSEEIGEINKSKRLLETELALLKKKEKKSQRYYRKRSCSDTDSGSSRRSRSVSSRETSSVPYSPPIKRSCRMTSPPSLSTSLPTDCNVVIVSSAQHEVPVTSVTSEQAQGHEQQENVQTELEEVEIDPENESESEPEESEEDNFHSGEEGVHVEQSF